jgi:hypothetical protein
VASGQVASGEVASGQVGKWGSGKWGSGKWGSGKWASGKWGSGNFEILVIGYLQGIGDVRWRWGCSGSGNCFLVLFFSGASVFLGGLATLCWCFFCTGVTAPPARSGVPNPGHPWRQVVPPKSVVGLLTPTCAVLLPLDRQIQRLSGGIWQSRQSKIGHQHPRGRLPGVRRWFFHRKAASEPPDCQIRLEPEWSLIGLV